MAANELALLEMTTQQLQSSAVQGNVCTAYTALLLLLIQSAAGIESQFLNIFCVTQPSLSHTGNWSPLPCL